MIPDKASVEEHRNGDQESNTVVDSDEQQLEHLGYKQQLRRSWGIVESFASSFASVNFIAGVRLGFFLGIMAGGPLAMWTSFIIASVFMFISYAILAEICSALPISGSIYIWSAAAAGPKYGRFVGSISAWWAAAAWMTFVAIVCQANSMFLLSLVNVYNLEFPGGVSNDNVKWRVVMWIVAEGFLVISIAANFLPSRGYSLMFRAAMWLMLIDFLLNLIWFPIGASKRYGLRTGDEAFLATFNGTGAPPGWNWLLCFLFAIGPITGLDAAGHVAEETKNASTVTARSILSSAVVSAVGGFVTLIVFLVCTPNIETLFSLNAPQPFVLIYSMALGRGGAVFMTLLAVVELVLSNSLMILTTSRIIFAIARDGALPFSSWVGKVAPNGRPQNAVLVIYGFCALVLCTQIPSTVAFTSLMSGGLVPLIASYGLIALLRLFVTPDKFKSTKFPLGKASKLFYVASVLFNALLFAVLVSPFVFPVNAKNLNFGGIIFGAVTIFGVISYLLTPEEKWLPREKIQHMYDGADEAVGVTAHTASDEK